MNARSIKECFKILFNPYEKPELKGDVVATRRGVAAVKGALEVFVLPILLGIATLVMAFGFRHSWHWVVSHKSWDAQFVKCGLPALTALGMIGIGSLAYFRDEKNKAIHYLEVEKSKKLEQKLDYNYFEKSAFAKVFLMLFNKTMPFKEHYSQAEWNQIKENNHYVRPESLKESDKNRKCILRILRPDAQTCMDYSFDEISPEKQHVDCTFTLNFSNLYTGNSLKCEILKKIGGHSAMCALEYIELNVINKNGDSVKIDFADRILKSYIFDEEEGTYFFSIKLLEPG